AAGRLALAGDCLVDPPLPIRAIAGHVHSAADFRRASCRFLNGLRCAAEDRAEHCEGGGFHSNRSRLAISPKDPPVWIKTGTAPGRAPPARIVAIMPVLPLRV